MASENTNSYSTPSYNSYGTLPSHLPLPFPTTEDYFSIDDVLASQQKVSVEFEKTVYRLGFLNTSSNEEHLQPGLKMELPFWLAKVLEKKQAVRTDLPKGYKEAQRQILSADASVVDLYKMEPHYYSMGLKLLKLEHAQKAELSRSLLETFLNRFRMILDNSQNAFHSDNYLLTSKLDEKERWLFKIGQKARLQLDRWERGTSHKLGSLDLKTRKRTRQPSQ